MQRRVWIHLDKDNPAILEPLRNGKPLWHGDSLDGTEEVVERPDLLPDILECVPGEKRVDPFHPI